MSIRLVGTGRRFAAVLVSLTLLLGGCTKITVSDQAPNVFEVSSVGGPDEAFLIITLLTSNRSLDDPIWFIPANPQAQLSATAAGDSLNDFTPLVPFVGNRTLLYGGALGTAGNPTGAVYGRMEDCGLTQFVVDSEFRLSGASVSSLPNVERHLRDMAGLPALTSAFAAGCADDDRGQANAPAAFLGRTAGGDLVAAGVDFRGRLFAGRADTAARVRAFTQLGARVAADISSGDFNADGIADVVVPFQDASGTFPAGTAVYLSRADGSFAAPTVLPVAGVRFFANAAVADVNGDSRADIVVQHGNDLFDSTLTTFLGNGSGGFTAGPIRGNAGEHGPFVLADINGDGRRDVVTSAGFRALGQGDGAFAAPVRAWSVVANFVHLAAGDIDRDGAIDIVAITAPRGGLVTVLRGTGDGNFVEGRSYAASLGTNTLGLRDIDGDGSLDIVVGLSGNGLYTSGFGASTITQFLLGRGDGTFVGAPALPSPSLSGAGASDRAPVAVLDIDADGKDDILTPEPRALSSAQPSGSGRLLLQRGAASDVAAPSFVPIAAPAAVLVASGDIDGDGRVDAIYAARDRVAVVRGQSGGTFAGESAQAIGNDPVDLQVADFNGDGRADVALLQVDLFGNGAQSGLRVFFGRADGSLSAPIVVDAARTNAVLAVGRLDSDARADLVIADSLARDAPSSVRTWRGNADGSFSAGSTLAPGRNPVAVAIADLDANSNAELVVAAFADNATTALFVHPGNGDGSFAQPITRSLGAGEVAVSSLAVAEFNGDGAADVAFTRDGLTSFLLGTRDGRFRADVSLGIAGDARHLIAADVDGDQQRDLLATVPLHGVITLLNRTNESTESPPPPPPPPTNEFSLAPANIAGSLSGGGQLRVPIEVRFGATFAGEVTFSCANLPANSRCSFDPQRLSPGGGPTSTTLTIRTGIANTVAGLGPGVSNTLGGGGLAVATVALLVARRRPGVDVGLRACTPHRLGRSRGALALLFCAALAACGGGGTSTGNVGSSAQAITPPGSYDVQVSASGGGVTRAFTYRLTVN